MGEGIHQHAPKIFHITHVANLPRILEAGCLWSDAHRRQRGIGCHAIGLGHIKRRRLETLNVPCHPGTTVGQYVPFYFCPRSIMLYILHRGNHPDITYTGGQAPILHLQADFRQTIEWANGQSVRWAFTDRNAGSFLASFYKHPRDLDKIDWNAVEATDFRDPQIKEGKQAEFLMFEAFPWTLVEKIGVCHPQTQNHLRRLLKTLDHRPKVRVEPLWYY